MTGDFLAFLVLMLATATAVLWSVLRRQRRAYRAAKTRADRLAGFLLAMSRANRAVLRIQQEDELWLEACRICVDSGHAVLACVYALDGTLARRVATAGPAAKVLENVPDPLDLSNPDLQGSYTARVLRDGVRLVSNDYVLDPKAGRWREEAVAQGVRAIAWIPLRRAGAVTAVLMLCGGDREYFDAELLALLDELGEDLSFALDNIDGRNERMAALREIEAGRDRFRQLFDASPAAMAIVSIEERRILEINEALCRRYDTSRQAIMGTLTASHAYGVVPEDRDLFYQTLNTDGCVRDLVLTVRDASGGTHLEVFNAEPMEYMGQACCLVTSLDFTHLQFRQVQANIAPTGHG